MVGGLTHAQGADGEVGPWETRAIGSNGSLFDIDSREGTSLKFFSD